MNYKIEIIVEGEKHFTLADILPEKPPTKILFIAKTPAPVSVAAGHYFQGRQGTMFWNKLSEYNILKASYGKYPDECLLDYNYGITDIVKKPRGYGNEPSDEEYREGLERINNLIQLLKPKVIVFVYKRVLDKIMKLNFDNSEKANYGFNSQFDNFFNSKVFVFPMPGTPCTKMQAIKAMTELKEFGNE